MVHVSQLLADDVESDDSADSSRQACKLKHSTLACATIGLVVLASCGGFLVGAKYQHRQIAIGSEPELLWDILPKTGGTWGPKGTDLKFTGSMPMAEINTHIRRLRESACKEKFWLRFVPVVCVEMVKALFCWLHPDGDVCSLLTDVAENEWHNLQHNCRADEKQCTIYEYADHGGAHKKTGLCFPNECVADIEKDVNEIRADVRKDAPDDHTEVKIECDA